MKSMDAGQLTERVTFKRKGQVRAPDGSLTVTWTPVLTAWARVRPKSGNQRNMAQQTENPADYEITVYNSADARALLASDIAEWQNRPMNIVWIGHAPTASQWLHMDAKDGVAV